MCCQTQTTAARALAVRTHSLASSIAPSLTHWFANSPRSQRGARIDSHTYVTSKWQRSTSVRIRRVCVCVCVCACEPPLQAPITPPVTDTVSQKCLGAPRQRVSTIVSVCVSDRERLGDTEGALCRVDAAHAHTHTHTLTLKERRQCALSPPRTKR